MKILHPLDVRNRDGGLPTAQDAKPRSLRPAHKQDASSGPWEQSAASAPEHGAAHGSKPSAGKPTQARSRTPAPIVAAEPRPRRRSRLPILIFVGLIGYWAYVNLLPPDRQNMIHDQIRAATK